MVVAERRSSYDPAAAPASVGGAAATSTFLQARRHDAANPGTPDDALGRAGVDHNAFDGEVFGAPGAFLGRSTRRPAPAG